MRSNKLIFQQISLIILFSIILSTVAYIFSPNLSYATESVFTRDTGNVGLITTDKKEGSKILIKEHSGSNTVGTGSGKGFMSLGNVETYLESYMNPHDHDSGYSWLDSLYNCDSIFCSYRGQALPNVERSHLITFHGTDVETNVEDYKDDKSKYLGMEKVDYVEHLPNKEKYYCKDGIQVLGINWTTGEDGESEKPKTTTVYETDFKYTYEKSDTDSDSDPGNDSGVGNFDDYLQKTLVNVQYTASQRSFTDHEAYFLSYSNPSGSYSSNPAQNANWADKKSTKGWSESGTQLYAASIAMDYFDNNGRTLTFPEMTRTYIDADKFSGVDLNTIIDKKTTDAFVVEYGSEESRSVGTGTIIDGSDYIIGPIHMNDYDYAWCEYAVNYSGKDVKDYPPELMAGIIKATIKLDGNSQEITLTKNNFGYYKNSSGALLRDETKASFVKNASEVPYGEEIDGSTKVYEAPGLHPDKYIYPTPNSDFYIRIPISSCTNSTKVEEIKMTYIYHSAEGEGGDMYGKYYELTWTGQKQFANGCNPSTDYICPNTDSHGHTCANTKRTSALAIDDVTYYSHNFICNAPREYCQYGSNCLVTKYDDATYGENRYSNKITEQCKSTWDCDKKPHVHHSSSYATYDNYQLEDGLSPDPCSCGHYHTSIDACFSKVCSYYDGQLLCNKYHKHGVGCTYSKYYCDHLYEGCTDDYCKVDTTNPNNPVECDHKHDGGCCSKTPHEHDYYDCYHRCDYPDLNDAEGSTSCYERKCGHIRGTTTCPTELKCCTREHHIHKIGECGKRHDCGMTYCVHGSPTAEHNCTKNYDGTEHKGNLSGCKMEDWGDTHVGKCKGKLDSDTPSRCPHHHANCKELIWKVREEGDIEERTSQDLLWVGWSKVYKHDYACSIKNIPLVTKVEINKYIYDVEHSVKLGVDDTLKASDDREKLTEEQKEAFPVYVEKGDEVTYKIVLSNYSGFDVSLRVDDVLPKGDYKFVKANIGGTTYTDQSKLEDVTIGISKGSEANPTKYSFTVTIRVEALEGTYENKARIITRNGQDKSKGLSTDDEFKPDIDFIRSSDNGDYGPIVNSKTVKSSNGEEPEKLEASDFYTLNNYNAFIDKYVYKYDQLMQDENNLNGYTQETSIVNENDELLVSRENTTQSMADYVDPKDAFKLTDKRRTDNGAKEEYKENHPVNVEKYETITYAIKVSNDATKVTRDEPTGVKYATKVRPSEVIDRMHKGLVVTDVDGKIYDGTKVVKDSLGVSWSGPVDDGEFNKYTITLDNETILEPGQHMLFLVEAQVIQSNMYLPSMENKAELTKVTNVNSTDDEEIEITPRNIAEHRETSEFIRMKDLIIAGKVWVDFDRDGLMHDESDPDRNKLYGLIGVNEHAMKKDILVSLYKNGNSTPVRTTRTDSDGFFTFGRGEDQGYHATFNYNNQYSSSTTYQRVDKASGKDGNGNYSEGSQYIDYYIQYEYDGVIYKSTEIYAGMDNLSKTNDGTFSEKYLVDSNAAERPVDRDAFNQKYKYVSYNIMRDQNKVAQPDGVLTFNKEGHISTLDESDSRKMHATSFINLGTNNINYLWLFDFNSAVSEEIPETEYLKYINLGLELREDVDIALFKDVYSVTTLIDGEEIEYAFNQKSGINGEEGYDNYMITNPYGLELYEADYKKRVDQYISEAVRDYKGFGSELNVNVTYRITVNNVPTVDDKYLLPECKTDEKLDVRIHEILDLYDQNFKTYSDTETVEVKVIDENGFLKSENRKISEAWFFKEGASGTKYKKVETATGEPIYVEDPAGTYGKVPLIVSNTSVYSDKANSFLDNGYKTMYIRTADETDVVIGEGEKFDIYVKYTLDKDKAEVTVNTETFEDTKTLDTSVVIDGIEYPMSVSTTTTTTTLERSLKIAEDVENKLNPKGIENIAQVNAYSVHYEDGDPAALVDVDSNAGNVGVGEGRNNTNEGNCDDKELYEDMTYKTGIHIIANNTENTENDIPGEGIIEQKDIKRDIKGKVWDDSKTETKSVEGEPGATIFYADGRSDTSADKLKAAELFEVKTNENVKMNYDLAKTDAEKNEKADLPIRNVKVEFIEIVKLPNGRYYEQLLRNVTWEQEQQVRSNENGEYILRGLTPGDYVIRFTYGDTISDDEPHVTNVAQAREDMRIFNGQDYKSTKYTLALSDDETDVDTIIQSFNEPGTSDARDDEMRRLTVNKYSEVMTNQKAEILKGLINDENSSISNRYNPLSKNSEEDLTELTDKTHMYAETIEFTLKPEKFKGEQITKYIKYGLEKDGGIYYDVQTIVANEDIDDRDYIIENLDFGIEYRPESQISLTKEINQMKLTAEDGTLLVDLYFYTEGEGKDTIHKIDKEKSKGLDVVQFVTNKYTDKATKVQALVNKIVEEQVQGFVYIQVDDEILQGATVEITYKFFAQNNSELDMIRDVLDEIRYKENKQTVALIDKYREKGHDILDEDYTASGTAENALLTELYGLDENAAKGLGADFDINKYIDLVDRLESTEDPIVKATLEQEKANIISNYLYRIGPKTMTKSGDDGYYGRYVGYGYYTGYAYPTGSGLDKKDVVACLKFDKILDYVDTNLEYTQETNNEKLENRFWVVTDAEDLNDHVYALRNNQLDLVNVGGAGEEVKKITNVDGQMYNSLVVSVDDSLFDDIADRRPDNADPNKVVLNKNLSRFLLPFLADKTADKTQSKGYIYLPTSKVIAAETDTDDLQYENIAEIIQFTTVTGRRTNFETTIGNANVHSIDKTPGGPNIGSEEFETASFEPDTAATETITLTPPTGLMLSRRAIVNVVETTTKGLGITAIVAAVVGIVFAVTTVTRLIIKKRRIK